MDNVADNALVKGIKEGKIKICPSCGHQNGIDYTFCEACGRQFNNSNETKKAAFKPLKEKENTAYTKTKAAAIKVQFMAPIEIDEKHNAFAEGLPDWSIEPPQIVVRRIKK